MADARGAAGRAGGGVRRIAAFLSLLLVPWALRALLLAETEVAPVPADLHGFAADAGVAAVGLALLFLLARLSRAAAVALVLLFASLEVANYETVLALGSVVSLGDAAYLGDMTFLSGSAAALTHPLLVFFLMVGVAALAWFGFGGAQRPPAWGILAAGLVLLAATAAWPLSASVETWRQANPVQRDLLSLLRGGAGARERPNSSDALAERLPELRGDLTGAPRVALGGGGRNVLLVVVEGVSGAYLQSAARVHRRNPALRMKQLDSVFRENVG
ncbi:MAG: hypothetical protein QF391_13295, partial [Myxococcota bacterium]|nr:hypothetical protein [Myxococcota bacterium]